MVGVVTQGVRLTAKRIADGVAEASARRRDLILWCVEPKGFGCRIRASGAASYIFQYRPRGGRSAPVRKLTIGKLETYAVDDARAVARLHAQTVAEGGDPQRAKMEARETPTVFQLFEAYLKSEGWRLSDRTVANARSHMRNQLAVLGKLRVDDVRKRDVAAAHAKARATPYAANRAMAVLSSLFAYAEAQELIAPGSNPVKGLRRYPEIHRERMLSADEVAALWSALIDLQTDGRHRFGAPAIMVGMLTGWRVGEVRTLRWAVIDRDAREAVISGKTGARVAPYPKACAVLFEHLWEIGRHFGRPGFKGEFVFPCVAGAGAERAAITDWEHHRTWAAAVEAAALEDVRRHDLRHLIAGLIGMQTGSALRVKEAMGHRSIAMSERYVAPITALQRRSTEQAAALVLAFAEGETAP